MIEVEPCCLSSDNIVVFDASSWRMSIAISFDMFRKTSRISFSISFIVIRQGKSC